MSASTDKDWSDNMNVNKKSNGRYGDVVFKAKGKEFSKVSVEVMGLFDGWLKASELCEEEFFEAIKRSDFLIHYSENPAGVSAFFTVAGAPYGVPFICNKDTDVARFKVDLALILMYVGSECKEENILTKIVEFIKVHNLYVA